MKAASIVNEAYFDSHRKYFHFWGRFLNRNAANFQALTLPPMGMPAE